MNKKPTQSGSLTNSDLNKIAGLLDQQFEQRLAPLATKADLAATETRIKAYVDEGVETIMTGMDNLMVKADKKLLPKD